MNSQPAASHPCPAWLGRMLDNPLRARLHDRPAILGPWVRPGQQVADVGAGSGFFTFALAEAVGPAGRVYAIDVQPAMLRQIEQKAAARGVTNVVTVPAQPEGPALPGPLDFVLMFWMLHEAADAGTLLRQMHALMRAGGTVLFAEPKWHVPASRYGAELEQFAAAGFRCRAPVAIRWSRAAAFDRP